MDATLTSAEAAERLGITVPTLYVYVSRGLIESHRRGGRRSYYAREDVERLAARSRGGAGIHPAQPSSAAPPLGLSAAALTSSTVTRIDATVISYRGEPIQSLTRQSFESVAELLWLAEASEWGGEPIGVPSGLAPLDRLRCAVVLAAAHDPFRSDRRPEAVLAAARRLLAGLSQTLGAPTAGPDSIATRVAGALSGATPDDSLVRAVDTMMVLLADHGLTPSTVAVRLAASARSDLYSALMAGLGVLAGPYYGGDSEAATRLLRYSAQVGVERAIDEELRWRNSLPGFGVSFYADGDPRFAMIRPHLEPLLDAEGRALLDTLLHHTEQQRLPAPNMDLALALLTYSTEADASFGPAIFCLARMAGWVAHYLEELREPVDRFTAHVIATSPSP